MTPAPLTTDELLEALQRYAPMLEYGEVACKWFCSLKDGPDVLGVDDTPRAALQAAWELVQKEK